MSLDHSYHLDRIADLLDRWLTGLRDPRRARCSGSGEPDGLAGAAGEADRYDKDQSSPAKNYGERTADQ